MIPTFSISLQNLVISWLPQSSYIDNEKSIVETGNPDKYFVQWGYPDIFRKYILLKHLLKVEILGLSLFFSFIMFILQGIVFVICGAVITAKYANYWEEMYFIFLGVFDYSACLVCATAVIYPHIELIKKQVSSIRTQNTISKLKTM